MGDPLVTSQTTQAPASERITETPAATGPGRPKRRARAKYTRAQPSQAEQARRKAWAKEWRTVGRDWRRAHTNEGT